MDRSYLRVYTGAAMGVGILTPSVPHHALILSLINDNSDENKQVNLMAVRNAAGQYMQALYALTETIDQELQKQHQNKTV